MSISGPNMRSSDTAMDVDSIIEELQEEIGSEPTIEQALQIGLECTSDGENLGILAAAAWLIEDGGYLATDFSEDQKAQVLAAIEAELHYDRLIRWHDGGERQYELECFRSIVNGQDPLGNVYAPIVELSIKLRRDYYLTTEHFAIVVTQDVAPELAYQFIRQVQAIGNDLLRDAASPRAIAREARAQKLKERRVAAVNKMSAVSGEPISERHQIALDLARFIIENDLATPYGGEVVQDESIRGKPRRISFSKPRHLDGELTVYGPTFIHLSYTTGFRDLPQKDERVFLNLHDALAFMRLAFVEHKAKEALQIPVKGPKAE